jgi:hypothetical protein
MIKGNASGATAVMSNTYRVYVKEGAATFSEFEKMAEGKNENKGFLPPIASISGYDYTKVSTAPVPQIRFNTLLNNEGVRQMVLGFSPESTDGVDHAMDALLPSKESPADVYFVLDNKEYVIDIIDFDMDKKIPIGFKNTNEANFKITVKEILNFTDVDKVYLHDKIADTYFDIKDGFYEMVLPPGVNNTQYEITFKNTDALGNSNVEIRNLDVLMSNDTKNLVVSNPQNLELSSCILYDAVGKLIFNKKVLGTNALYEFSTSGLSDGIYIVKLITKNNSQLSKKIIIKN